MEPFSVSPDPADCIFRHVTRTSRAVVAAYDRALARVGITGQQFNILMTLNRLGRCTVGKLASRVGMDPSTLPRTIAPLARQDWITVEVGPDRRTRLISISESGAQALAQAVPIWSVVQTTLLEKLPRDHWSGQISDLRTLREAVSELDAF